MLERRRHPRRRLSVTLDAFDARSGRIVGRLADVTVAGFLLLCADPVQVGEELDLELRWDGTTIPFAARAAWCRRDLNPDYYAVGFAITEIAPEAHARLQLLIRRFALEGVA